MLNISDYRENVALMLDMSILGPLPCTLFFLFAVPAAEMSMLFQNTLYMKDVGYTFVASFLRERFSPFLVTTDHLSLLLAQYFLLVGRFCPAFGLIAFANFLISLRQGILHSLETEGNEENESARSERSTVF